MLFKKMLRDIWKAKAQFLSVIIIAACGVFTFVGSITVGTRLEVSVSGFYQASKMNDIWINVREAKPGDVQALAGLPGVEEAQGRNSFKVQAGNRSVDLFVINENKVAQPYLAEGEPFQSMRAGIWLDREFAFANGLKTGDTFSVRSDSGKPVNLVIQGLVLSPEKMIDVSSETLSTRHDLYGYGYMAETAAFQAFSVSGFNQILVKIKPDADVRTIVSDAEQLLGGNYLNSLTHEEHPSTTGAASQIAQFKTIGYITPLLFFLLAMLVVVSTMSRLIANQRVQIGTLMSLGISARQIKWHYLSYGLFLGASGGIAGLTAGYYGIPAIFMGTLRNSFILPKWSEVFPVETILSIVVVCACCMLAVQLACGSKLKELPAAVLKGKAPSSPGKSVLESLLRTRFGASFEHLWLLRNLRSHKVRGLMGIIGSFGCAFLILFGFANIDSSNKSVEVEFDRQYLYQHKADLQAKAAAEAAGAEWSQDGVQPVQEGRIVLKLDNNERNIPVTVIGEGDYINLDVSGPDVMPVPDEGIVLSEKMAGVLGVKKGGIISMRDASGRWDQVVVADTIRAPAADRAYLSDAAWAKIGESFVPTGLLLGEHVDLERIKAQYPVRQLISKEDMKEANRELNEGVFASAAGLTFAAIFLGITVLYSIGLVNLTEMSREFATLKVLGFRHQEICKLLFSESFLLTIIGTALALPAGWGAIHALDKLNVSEGMTLFPDIKPVSYLSAIAITLLCAGLVNGLISGKLRRVDMVSSLKSVE